MIGTRGSSAPSSQFAENAKLDRCVDLLEGRKALRRGLDRLDRWAEANRVRLNKAQRWVLSWVTTTPRSAAGSGRGLGSCLAGKGLGVLVDGRLNTSWHCAQVAREANSILAGI